MALILQNQSLALQAYAVLVGQQPGYTALNDHLAFISTQGIPAYSTQLNNIFLNTPTATLAATMITNLGLTGIVSQAEAIAYLNSSPNHVEAMINLSNTLYTYAGTDASIIAARDTYKASIDTSYAYSIVPANTASVSIVAGAGSTFTLTTGADNIQGTSGNDIVNGYANASSTYNASDVINGGGGVNTLNVVLDGANGGAALISNIQTINLRAATAQSFDAGSTTGATLITSTDSAALATVNNIKALTTGLAVATSSAGATFKFADAAVTSTSDTANLTVNGVTGGTITIASATGTGIETIALTGSTAASKGFTLTEGGTLTKVTIAGNQTVGVTVSDATITTLDASANTAGVDVDARALTGTFAITGTAKDDRIVVANANTSSADTVTGGDGTDTLGVVVASGATYTHSSNTKVTGFESFELIDDATVAAQTITAALDGSFATLKTSGGNGGDDTFTFTGVANNTTLTLSVDSAAVNSTLKANTATDTLSIVLDGTTAGTVTAGSVETVNVTSQADSANNANTLTALTITAATAVNVKGAFTANLGTLTTAANSTVSAADFTGATLTANLSGAVVKSYVGSANKDLITIASDSLNSANTFAGGAGTGDTLTDAGVTGNQGILNVTGFETVTATLAGDAALDVRNVTDMTKLVINSTSDSITVDRLNVTTTAVTLDATAAVADTIAAATFTANTGTTFGLTFNANNAADTITTLTLDSGITTLNLTVDGSTAATTGLVVTNAISSLGLTSLTVKGDGLATFSGTQSSNLVSVDASTATGPLQIALGATTGTTTILGGSLNDTLTGNTAADTINGNGGADILTGATGANKYVIDSAAEARGATYAGTITTSAANIELLTTFVATGAADTIQLGLDVDAFGSGITLTAATNVVVTNIGAIATVAYADLAAALAAVQANTAGIASSSATLQAYSFTIADSGAGAGFDHAGGAGTYILINDGTAAINSSDTIIKVGTVTGTLATSDFVFA